MPIVAIYGDVNEPIVVEVSECGATSRDRRRKYVAALP